MQYWMITLIVGIFAALITTGILKYGRGAVLTFRKISLVQGWQISESGVIGLWKDRHNIEAIEAVKDELKNTDGEIKMSGVALPDFFRSNNKYSDELSSLFKKPSVTFRILLLDPNGRCADERATIETIRSTIADIDNTIEYLQAINAESKITVHLYDIAPTVFFIMTSECLFIEHYHYGRPSDDLRCLGGQTIFLKLNKKSNTYKCMKQHFEYIWCNKSKEV